MTETQKLEDWKRFVRASSVNYRMNALRAVYENDGEEMLRKCLDSLGWRDSVDLVKNCD